jgi:hypothetical protein
VIGTPSALAAVEIFFRLCGAADVQSFALELLGPDLGTGFLTKNLAAYAPFYALFLVGPVANLIEIWQQAYQWRVMQVSNSEFRN